MIEVTLKTNNKAVRQFLNSVSKNLGKFSVPLKQSGILMMRSIDLNFREQGRPDKWKPLAPSTIAGRRKKGAGGIKILQDKGRLKGDISPSFKGKNTIAIGTAVTYAKFHQFGVNSGGASRSKNVKRKSGSGRRTIPKRPFLLFQENDKKNIIKIFSEHVGRTLSKSAVQTKG